MVFSLDPHFRRIIPAYAGSTCPHVRSPPAYMDHPRIRGEHDCGVMVIAGTDWIIPAYAGSTLAIVLYESPHGDHPRIRGEHPSSEFETYHDGGSSPHTRGARPHGLHCRYIAGIIPAYAGSTDIRFATLAGN